MYVQKSNPPITKKKTQTYHRSSCGLSPRPLDSRRLGRVTGHGTSGVVLASGPQIAADLRGFAKRHADARGTEEGVGGAVVHAEVKVYVCA